MSMSPAFSSSVMRDDQIVDAHADRKSPVLVTVDRPAAVGVPELPAIDGQHRAAAHPDAGLGLGLGLGAESGRESERRREDERGQKMLAVRIGKPCVNYGANLLDRHEGRRSCGRRVTVRPGHQHVDATGGHATPSATRARLPSSARGATAR